MSGPQSKRAAFLDRDGTIIRDAAYVRDPKDVELLPGAVDAIRRLNERDVAVIVVTNQSGIARGLLDHDDYERVRARVEALVADGGARIDATYMCPHYPEITGACDCRKPGLGLYRRAIAEHGLDASSSLFVGDRWRDVAPSAALGGTAILLDVDSTPPEDRERARRERIETASSLGDAVNRYLNALPAPHQGQ
jgi:D-glycero-D-manno-heptose 1,7-bisphosphate phosphatase